MNKGMRELRCRRMEEVKSVTSKGLSELSPLSIPTSSILRKRLGLLEVKGMNVQERIPGLKGGRMEEVVGVKEERLW